MKFLFIFLHFFSVFKSANQARSVVGPFQTHQCHLLKREKSQRMKTVESNLGKRWLKPTTQLLQRKSFEAKIVSKFRVLDFWSPVHDVGVSYPSANFLPKRMFEKQVLPPEPLIQVFDIAISCHRNERRNSLPLTAFLASDVSSSDARFRAIAIFIATRCRNETWSRSRDLFETELRERN